MTELARLKFYATQPHSCSYLPEEQATTLFLDPSQPMDVHVYADLSEMGFRRSGDHLYRPHCQNCNACVPARIPVAQFNPNRQQKRIFKRNADLQVRPVFHYSASRVRAHVFLCMLAYYVEWHMREAWREQRFADTDSQAAPGRAAIRWRRPDARRSHSRRSPAIRSATARRRTAS